MSQINLGDHDGELKKAVRNLSPFRYPGGKAFLSAYLASKLARLDSDRKHYAEPFCGGAGAALLLLAAKKADHLYLNDADIRVYSAWKAMRDETDRFIERVQTVELNLTSWESLSEVVKRTPPTTYDFDLGFATFFLNRTSRSGIVAGAGPIGGYAQTGQWKIDARFNRQTLSERIQWVGDHKTEISLFNEDGLTFLYRLGDRVPIESCLLFVDPPYVKAGGRLYLDAMNEGKHIALSDMLQNGTLPHWVLTYDDHPLIRSIYKELTIDSLGVQYSLQSKRKDSEILITTLS